MKKNVFRVPCWSFFTFSILAMLGQVEAKTIAVNCGNPAMAIGTIEINLIGGANAGVTGGFTSSVLDGDGKPSLAAAAAKCGEESFNWYQPVTADSDPPTDHQGNQLTPPYVDPPPGGYPGQWADTLPWYYDEYDPPGGAPGFDENNDFDINEQTMDPNNDNVDEFLKFADQPNGAAGTMLTFKTWLVSLNADGSLHDTYEGFKWTFEEKDGENDVSTIDGAALPGGTPADSEYGDLLGGFDSKKMPTEVWDWVTNNSPNTVAWGPGRWTRNGNTLGQTHPNNVIQGPTDPPVHDHKTMPQRPNDFHFVAVVIDADDGDSHTVTVWSKWTDDGNGFQFDFPLLTPEGDTGDTDFHYEYDFTTGELIVTDVTNELNQIIEYSGPIEFYDISGLTLNGFEQMMVVPEPSSFVLIAIGLVGLFFYRRKQA